MTSLGGGISVSTERATYQRPSFELRRLRHIVLRPRRIEDDIDARVGDAVDGPDLFLHLRRQPLRCRTAGAVSVIRTPTTALLSTMIS